MKKIFTLRVTSKPTHLSHRFFGFFPGICQEQPAPVLLAVPHATLPCEHMGDVAVGEQTQRLKSRKVSLAKQESKQRRDFTQMQYGCQSARETRGRREQCCRKTGSTALPMEKATLMHTGNFPSESHPSLESRLVSLLRVRSADLISWKLSPTFRSDLSQNSFSRVQSSSSFPCIFFPLDFHTLTKKILAPAFGGHPLSLLTIRGFLKA